MNANTDDIPLLARRGVEAEIAARIYFAAQRRFGAQAARAVVEAAVSEAAHAAGAAFAARAPGGASLEHFAGVVESWRAGDALSIADVRLDAHALSFTVTRCGYVERYRALGVPTELFAPLSCSRDAAFAAGYSPHLSLTRPETIAGGANVCAFLFRWT